MEETLIFPSPNWYLVSNFAVSETGWIIYGGPRKSLCVLQPIPRHCTVYENKQAYKTHVAFKAHPEKIVSVSISPDFAVKKNLLSGAADGSVRQWTLDKYCDDDIKIMCTESHDIHLKSNEEIIGVGYSTESIAITVGGKGNIVKWDLNSNVCKTYNKLLNTFKPTSMSCSQHIALNVAVGTKQGVVFVLDLTDSGKVVYKVRSDDSEIENLSWCPQYEIQVSKYCGTESLSTSPKPTSKQIKDKTNTSDKNESHLSKQLPQDSFEGSSCQEDDMFDIYKDHEANEFGHKKYVPEDIVVKPKEKKPKETNYLQECLSLRELLLRKRTEPKEMSIESLVEAMDKAHVANTSAAENSTSSEVNASGSETPESTEINSQWNLETHEHVLATVGRYGSVKIWNKKGVMLASCIISQRGKLQRTKATCWPTILWASAGSLLVADGKSQLIEYNPLKIDCNNKLEYRVVHAVHKRGLFALATDAPRVQLANSEEPVYKGYLLMNRDPYRISSAKNFSVYSVSQDRNIVRYSIRDSKTIAIHSTCGGYLYNVQFCPYDAGRMAVAVGDGAVRVWDSKVDGGRTITSSKVRTYWQNVQGKVLSVAWHPTKENLLAFGTAESRVGLLDVCEAQTARTASLKPARVLHPALTGGVYSLCWGSDMKLFAVGGEQLVMYDASAPHASPVPVPVMADGQTLAVGAVSWSARGLLVGSNRGAVAVLHPELLTTLGVAYFYNKMVYMMEWHPLQVSRSNTESPHHDIIAVCSSDKGGDITIVCVKDGCNKKLLSTKKVLSGHTGPVLQLAWSPHKEELLLSTSSDGTVRVWNFVAGTCLSKFPGHGAQPLGAAWMPLPLRTYFIVSGGADSALRLWNYSAYEPTTPEERSREEYSSSKPFEMPAKYDLSCGPTTSTKQKKMDWEVMDHKVDEKVATVHIDFETRASKKYILPLINKQINSCEITAVRKAFQKFVAKEPTQLDDGSDFINIFGSLNELNQVLNNQSEHMLGADSLEGWITLSLFRGRIKETMDLAKEKNMLCPYLVNMASCVSLKYMQEVTYAYIKQIDRTMAKKKTVQLSLSRNYGGPIFQKVTLLLSIHNVKGAVDVLTDAKLHKEAYILCRLRYMKAVADLVLIQWAVFSQSCGNNLMASICYMVLGKYHEASTILQNYLHPEILNIAANLARLSGSTIFAKHIEGKAENITSKTEKSVSVLNSTEEKPLKKLPSRIELLLKHSEIATKPKNSTEEELDESSSKIIVSMKVSKGKPVEPLDALSSKTEELIKDVPLVTITSESAKDKTDEPLKDLPSKTEELMKDVPRATITSESAKEKTDEPLKYLPSKTEELMKDVPRATITSESAKDKTDEPLKDLLSKTEEPMKDVPRATITSESAKDKTDEPLKDLPSKTEELMKDVPRATITSESAKDRTDEPLKGLLSKTEEPMKDIPLAAITSESAKDRTDEPLKGLLSKTEEPMKDIPLAAITRESAKDRTDEPLKGLLSKTEEPMKDIPLAAITSESAKDRTDEPLKGLLSKTEEPMKDIPLAAITRESAKDRTDEPLKGLLSKTEEPMKDIPVADITSESAKDKTDEPLKDLPSKIEELMKDVLRDTITSEAEDRTDESLEELSSKIQVLITDVQSLNSETDNSDEDDIGHDFVTLQYEEIFQNDD